MSDPTQRRPPQPPRRKLQKPRSDLLCPAGEAIGTETIRYGQRVTVIALPTAEVFLTPKGLQHVGPRAFNYAIDFKSVFA